GSPFLFDRVKKLSSAMTSERGSRIGNRATTNAAADPLAAKLIDALDVTIAARPRPWVLLIVPHPPRRVRSRPRAEQLGLLLCVPEQARSLTELLCLFLMYPETPSQPA